jgi:glycosyltransferase involved in cell wall biosynthesis
MRIGLDGYPLAEPRTGVGHYTLELAHALARLAPSDQFELISPAPFDAAALADIEQLNGRFNLSNLRTVALKPSRIRGHWWGVGLPLYARRAGFDLFHGTNFELPLWRNRRSVVTIHDLSTLLYPETHRQPLVRRARRRLPLVAKLATRIITPTESIRREVCEHLQVKPDKVVAIPSAARTSFRPMPLRETSVIRKKLGIQEDFLLFVGTLEPRKNLLTLLKAFVQILRQTSLRPQLVVVGGDGWLMDETVSFLRDSKLEDHLRLTGYLGDQDLRILYSCCRIFIYPSLYEGFGLPPLEAMTCGAPVIAGRVGALQEVLGSAAHFVDPLDVEALAQSIVELLENEERRTQMAANGPPHAARYSWERTAQLTLDLYREVMEKRPA